MKPRHKAYHCTSLQRAGIQFVVSCVLAWFAVGMGLEQGNPFLWTPLGKLLFAILTILFTVVLFTNEVREERH